jgi:hypothetical protein
MGITICSQGEDKVWMRSRSLARSLGRAAGQVLAECAYEGLIAMSHMDVSPVSAHERNNGEKQPDTSILARVYVGRLLLSTETLRT